MLFLESGHDFHVANMIPCKDHEPLLFCQILGDGADGCQPVPGHSNGAGSREAVLSALSDVVWYQTPPRSWDHSQGEQQLSANTHHEVRPMS